MHSVVVLNKRTHYWADVSLKRVLKWIAKEKVNILVTHEDRVISGVDQEIPLPMVVQLPHWGSYKVKKRRVQYSPQAVYQRDKNICQYWHHDSETGKRFKYICDETERTIDHVNPKDLKGETSFENCVCCCRYHNETVKKNIPLKECGLELIRVPRVPDFEYGQDAYFHFSYNPNKPAHQYYQEQFLMREFTHRVN